MVPQVNDLERDERYASWPRELQTLLMPMYPGVCGWMVLCCGRARLGWVGSGSGGAAVEWGWVGG